MKIIFGIFIFFLVLFIYLHIQFHIKTSDELEIYEMEEYSKNKLEEICDVRQPVVFEFEESTKITEYTNKNYLINSYPSFEIKIRNSNESDINSELFIPLPLHSALKLFHEDKSGIYYSENNYDFLNETGIIKNIKYMDGLLRPYMVSNCNYDIMFGSENCTTPFRYEINYRNYFLVTSGSIIIKLSPPKSSKYLSPITDYENFEFKSLINPWNVQEKFRNDFEKIKTLEFKLEKGKIIFIPAFWWHSIKFEKDASITCFRYRTYMNNIAISPYIGMHILQLQNVKREVVKKVDIKDFNNNEKYQDDSKKEFKEEFKEESKEEFKEEFKEESKEEFEEDYKEESKKDSKTDIIQI